VDDTLEICDEEEQSQDGGSKETCADEPESISARRLNAICELCYLELRGRRG